MSLPRVEAPSAPGICVGIATRGRPEVLARVVAQLRMQTLTPVATIIACTSPEDVRGLESCPDLRIVVADPGLTRQRNAILDNLPDQAAFVAFFDDDFLAHPGWLASAMQAFAMDERLGCLTGHIVADGIMGPGLSFEAACTALQADDGREAECTTLHYSPYGCNMAFRRSAIAGLRFDERLVLYGWLEDRDFGGALKRKGWTLSRIGRARGVHMGTKAGRVPGRKLGYSQVVNPAYLRRKGTITTTETLRHIGRNLVANFTRSFAPEPFVDRRGRLQGNVLALLDIVAGRLTPERAERL